MTGAGAAATGPGPANPEEAGRLRVNLFALHVGALFGRAAECVLPDRARGGGLVDGVGRGGARIATGGGGIGGGLLGRRGGGGGDALLPRIDERDRALHVPGDERGIDAVCQHLVRPDVAADDLFPPERARWKCEA